MTDLAFAVTGVANGGGAAMARNVQRAGRTGHAEDMANAADAMDLNGLRLPQGLPA